MAQTGVFLYYCHGRWALCFVKTLITTQHILRNTISGPALLKNPIIFAIVMFSRGRCVCVGGGGGGKRVRERGRGGRVMWDGK